LSKSEKASFIGPAFISMVNWLWRRAWKSLQLKRAGAHRHPTLIAPPRANRPPHALTHHPPPLRNCRGIAGRLTALPPYATAACALRDQHPHRILSMPPPSIARSLWRPMRSRTTPAPRTGRGPKLPSPLARSL
jgi:hypothetical protein